MSATNGGWIGVDLDGTLAYYEGWQGANHIGAPISPMVERVKNWLASGKTVKIFTARMHGLWDDRAIQVESNTNRVLQGPKEKGQVESSAMNIINGPISTPAPGNAATLEMVRWRYIGKPYSAWRKIFSQTGDSDSSFLVLLKVGFDIEIDKDADPILYATEDTQQLRLLTEGSNGKPITELQMMMTAKAWALDIDTLKERMAFILEKMQEAEPPSAS